jgi:tetratricopeptide (TPR) repeat protein
LPPAIIHSLANYSISGTIFPVNISPSFFKYTGAVFDESNLSGVVANTTFKELAVYGFNCFFGPRGFFSYTPLLVFSVWGLIYALKKRDSWKKAFLILLTIVFILTFYIWRTKNYGGYSYGIRFFLAFLPPIFLMLIYIVDRVKKGMLLILYRFSIVWSCLFAAVGVLKPASDSALGWNSFAANLFHFQLLKFPSVTSRTWKIIAGLSGNRPEITSYIGTLMFNLDLLDPAEEALLFSMKKRELPLTYESLGNVYYAKGNYQQALYYYHTAYQRWSNPQVLYFLGQTYAEIGQQDSSIYYFVRLISDGDAISRNAPPALSKASLEFYHKYERDLAVANIANNYMIKGELDSAQIYLRQIVHQGTEIVKVVAARAKYLILTGKEASAIQYLENAFQQRPGLYQSLKRDEALYNAVEKAHSNLTSLRK